MAGCLCSTVRLHAGAGRRKAQPSCLCRRAALGARQVSALREPHARDKQTRPLTLGREAQCASRPPKPGRACWVAPELAALFFSLKVDPARAVGPLRGMGKRARSIEARTARPQDQDCRLRCRVWPESDPGALPLPAGRQKNRRFRATSMREAIVRGAVRGTQQQLSSAVRLAP
jgi:hypothetical protein